MPAKDNESPARQRLQPEDIPRLAAAVAPLLGDGWSVEESAESPYGATHLAHPDGRAIGIRRLWDGGTVQTFAIGVPRRELGNDGDAASYADSLEHVSPGIRYSVGAHLTAAPPAKTVTETIKARLLPAFGGERPPLRAFPRKSRPTVAGPDSAPASTGSADTSSSAPVEAGTSPLDVPASDEAKSRPGRKRANRSAPKSGAGTAETKSRRAAGAKPGAKSAGGSKRAAKQRATEPSSTT